MAKKTGALELERPRASDFCVQIDSDRIPSSLKYGGWENELARRLTPVAQEQEGGELVCFITEDASVDFGHHGNSVWLALSGSPPLVKAAKDIVFNLIDLKFRRAAVATGHDQWMRRITLKQNKVWVPKDIDALDAFCRPMSDDGQVTKMPLGEPKSEGPRSTDLCWQINAHALPDSLKNERWLDRLARRLMPIAQAHESSMLNCFVRDESNFDFGPFGRSVWLALTGSPPLVKAAKDIFLDLVEATLRRDAVVSESSRWIARISLKEGGVWVPKGARLFKESDIDGFQIQKPKLDDPCWQIDITHLSSPLDKGGWSQELAMAMRYVAQKHESEELATFIRNGVSGDFGDARECAWMACSGSPDLLADFCEKFSEKVGAQFRKPASVSSLEGWHADTRIASGQVWRRRTADWLEPDEKARWYAINFSQSFLVTGSIYSNMGELVLMGGCAPGGIDSQGNSAAPGGKVNVVDPNVQSDAGISQEIPDVLAGVAEVVAAKTKPKVKSRKFRSDVALGVYQSKLEKMYGMPEGSIRFINPDGTLAHPSQLVRTFRRRHKDG